jgi:hypothetical protein
MTYHSIDSMAIRKAPGVNRGLVGVGIGGLPCNFFNRASMAIKLPPISIQRSPVRLGYGR